MTPYWYIQNDFHEKRSTRIGASEISCLIPNPEKPNESLAGYEKTAVTLWQEKTGRKERSVSGLPAEMGHWNEVKAIELFIRGIPEIGETLSNHYVHSRLEYELISKVAPSISPIDYQKTPFKHNTQWYNDQFICHPDGVWDNQQIKPEYGYSINGTTYNTFSAHNLTIDLSRPFLIEAKTASYWSAKRRNGSLVSGYDFDLKTWQGIPLKHYVQIQFQLACMDVEVCYLPLLYDSASFHVWEIKRDRKTGDKLIDLAGRFAWHIKNDTPPKDMAMNALDIASLYPEINDDFQFLSGDDAEKAIEAARAAQRAVAQEKAWKVKKDDATDALAVFLKDAKELRVELDGNIVPVVKWIERKGAERCASLKEIKDGKPEVYKYLARKGCLNTSDSSRSIKVSLKEEEE